jgi:hypothetical protein
LEISSLTTPSPEYLVLPYILVDTNGVIVKTYTIKNSSAIGEIFLNESFAQKYNLTITKLDQSLRLQVIDSRDSSAGNITYNAQLQLQLGDHKEQILYYMTKLGQYNIILGHF